MDFFLVETTLGFTPFALCILAFLGLLVMVPVYSVYTNADTLGKYRLFAGILFVVICIVFISYAYSRMQEKHFPIGGKSQRQQ